MKLNKIIILSLFLVLICFIGAASASENVTDDIGAVSNDFAVDEVVSEVDSDEYLWMILVMNHLQFKMKNK